MNIGFVGSQFGMSPEQIKEIRCLLNQKKPSKICLGSSENSNYYISFIAEELGIPIISSKDQVCDQDLILTNIFNKKKTIAESQAWNALNKCIKNKKKIVMIFSNGSREEIN